MSDLFSKKVSVFRYLRVPPLKAQSSKVRKKSFLYLRIERCLIIVDLRAIYPLKFTSEASHSRVSAYSIRLTSQDFPQMESFFEGEMGRTNFSAQIYLTTCIPTCSNFVDSL